MSTRIPFKVSARTARLIGRENAATSKGAVIELVKNCYDADSRYCIVLIDNRLGVYHDRLNKMDYARLVGTGVAKELLEGIYEEKEDGYYEKAGIDIEMIGRLKGQLKKNATLYIVDEGEGMGGENDGRLFGLP